MKLSIVIFSLIVIYYACTDSNDSQEYLIRLETDQNIYSADSTTIIHLNVSNNGKSPVYFLCKGVIVLEEYENGALNDNWPVNGREYCGSINPINPNTTQTWDLTFLSRSDLPDAKFNENVFYKLYFDLYTDNNLKNPMNIDDQRANYFKIISE